MTRCSGSGERLAEHLQARGARGNSACVCGRRRWRVLCAAVRLGGASGEAARRWDKSGSSERHGERRGGVVRFRMD